MLNLRSAAKCRKLVLVIAATGILAGAPMLAGQAGAQEGQSTQSSSVTRETASVKLKGQHHYQSAAGEAHDALLITEVKTALNDDGVADGAPIVVDCDHGKILLSGVMKSAEDARRAGNIAARAPGVIAVRNHLTWR